MIIDTYYYMCFDKLPSTQTYLKNELKNGKAKHCDVISAISQTDGYGKYARPWIDRSENVAISILLKVDYEISLAPQINYVAGLAIIKTLQYFTKDLKFNLKWVNDVHINNYKIAGILCELIDNNVIVGIGVNLRSNENIISLNGKGLSDFDITVDREIFITKLLENFKHMYNQWEIMGFSMIQNMWSAHAKHVIGEAMTIKQAAGKEVHGLYQGIDEDGNLVLDVSGKRTTIYAGEL